MSRISIIVCVKDVEETIGSMFVSLIHQTAPDNLFDVIVINDGSTDSSHDIIQKYSSCFESFKYINRKENKGVVFSMNEGVMHVTTDWFMRLDPDDTLNLNALEQYLKVIEGSYDLILSHRVHIKKNKKKLIKVSENIFTWIGCGVLIKTEKARKINLFRNIFWEEFDFYIRYIQEGYNRFHIIDLPLYEYLIRTDSITSSKIDREKGFEELKKIHGIETLVNYGYSDQEFFCDEVCSGA